ncbi:WG repeat-containing protein [Bacteroides thetaiotaomicron]|nr:WG repeat-containing protein [Bacteroides thetaiotaomicron]
MEYEYVDLPVAGIIVVRKNGKYGVLSWKNKEILPCIYDRIINDMPIESIGDTREPKLIVLSNGNWSYYDKKGDIIRKNVPKEVIMESYGHRIERGEPSNENLDFGMKRTKK